VAGNSTKHSGCNTYGGWTQTEYRNSTKNSGYNTYRGWTQNTETSTAIQTERKKEHRETEEEMEGPTSSGGLRKRLTRLNLHERYDDDDDIHIT
jgi:hypothetical protein